MRHPLLIFCPYPNIDASGQLYDGFQMRQSEYCAKKCVDRVCRQYQPRSGEVSTAFTCPNEFSVIAAGIHDETVIINGVLDVSTNTSPPEKKKARRNRKINREEVNAWIRAAEKMKMEYEATLRHAAHDAVGNLHDVKAIIGNILKTTEAWIWTFPGNSIDDKVSSAPNELRTIYHSCRIVESLLLVADIAVNPEAAKYGQPRPASIYGMAFMLERVFRSRAIKQGLHLQLTGSSYNRPAVYTSFILVPLILIDNAIKYATPRSEVNIRVQDIGDDGVRVSIESFGKVVIPSERQRIFSKRYRGTNAGDAPGSGFGLWIAQTIAHIHGTEINYTASTAMGEGWNTFTIDVRSP